MSSFLVILATFATGQIPSPSPPPAVPKLSEVLSKNLESRGRSSEIPRESRERSYAKLMEAQRYIWRANSQRTQAGIVANVTLARSSLEKALEFDPGLAEGYTALAELAVNPNAPPNDVDEAIVLATMAIGLNKDNFGSHRLLARLYTFKSNLSNSKLDERLAAQAIGEWKEVTRLDPRNAEAWAFLSEFYDETHKPAERIEALKKWLASASPLDRQFYQRTMRGREDLSPESASAKLGPALLKAGRVQEAIEVLSQVIADDPENSEAPDQLKEALDSADAKTASNAIEALQQAVYANPGSLPLLELLADVETKAGKVDDAVRMLRNGSQKLEPTNRASASTLEVWIGDIYAKTDRLTDAAAAYELALSIRGLDQAQTLDQDEREFAIGVFDKLITVYKRANRIADAKAVILRARKLLGNNELFADRQLVSLYRETGNKAEALATVRSARTRNADDVTLLRLEAMILAESGQVDRAVELIRQRMSPRPAVKSSASTALGEPVAAPQQTDDDFSNYLFISQLYTDADRGADAIAAAQQAYSIAGGDERQQIAHLMLANAQQASGNFTAAEATLREILKQTPGNPIAMNNLGYFLLERGERYNEALDLIEKAVKVDPTNPSYLDSLGWANFKLDRFEQAEKYLKQAAGLDFASATIQEHLGDVFQKQGKDEMARAAWQKAVQLVSGAADSNRIRGKLASIK